MGMLTQPTARTPSRCSTEQRLSFAACRRASTVVRHVSDIPHIDLRLTCGAPVLVRMPEAETAKTVAGQRGEGERTSAGSRDCR
jgi:hypothetical protein